MLCKQTQEKNLILVGDDNNSRTKSVFDPETVREVIDCLVQFIKISQFPWLDLQKGLNKVTYLSIIYLSARV